MTYCVVQDLMTGTIPLPQIIQPEQYIINASEEIDISLGVKYQTPVLIDVTANPEQRPLMLLLKQINAFIASGRILLAATVSNEDNQVNAYGYSLLQGGHKMLCDLVDGSYSYPGLLPSEGHEERTAGPVVQNQDSFSGVDAFYARVSIPGQSFYPSGVGY